MKTRYELEALSGAELIDYFNWLGPISPVAKFSSKESGIERILKLQSQHEGNSDKAVPLGELNELFGVDEVSLPEVIKEVWDGKPPPPVDDSSVSPNTMPPNSEARNDWVANDAESTKFLTNRKEVVIFNGLNPRGLVQTIIREDYELDEDSDEVIAFEFFQRESKKASWPKAGDVTKHRATLVKVLIRNAQPND